MKALAAAVAPFLVGFALALLLMHPVFLVPILAAEVAFVMAMAVAIAARLGVTIPIPNRWSWT